jgi:transaldolase
MTKSEEYNKPFESLAKQGKSANDIYETLAIEDIQSAADHLRKVYDTTNGKDGFISLEVSPELAHDTDGTIAEAKRLWNLVNRPNLMIKVPGTPAGLPAIQQLLEDGLNINITLLFSLENYTQVRQIYIKALQNRFKAGKAIDRIASVASFFISRIDTLTDKLLQYKAENGNNGAKELFGKAAVSSGKIAYDDYLKDFTSSEFKKLAEKGANVQRPLWASTSTKNPDYSDVIYVEPLIGPDTVNTLPTSTVKAFRDHGVAKETIREGIDDARAALSKIEDTGIRIAEVTKKLQDDGVQLFIDAFNGLLGALEEKRKQYSQ